MRRKARRGGGRQVELTIDSVGGRGDGLGQFDGRPVFVPGTLPGEVARVRLVGERAGGFIGALLEIQQTSPERVEPPCPHFGPCGGCALQHWEPAVYKAWKQSQVTAALERRGFRGVEVRAMLFVAPQSRRRARMSAISTSDGICLGFHERAGAQIIHTPQCQILSADLSVAAGFLRDNLAAVMVGSHKLDFALSASETGLDLLVVADREPSLNERETWAGLADRADWARVAWQCKGREPEPIAERRRPIVTFGDVAVTLPPGAFLQPTQAGEAALVDAVLQALPDEAAPAIDLYAGLGTFSFPLAKRAKVHAVEGAGPALVALWDAAKQSGMAADRVSVEERDLARHPLTAAELSKSSAVIFNPPRMGARSQAVELAESDVPTLVGVSCNPNTFARDARILVDGGYKLNWVQPLDQFPWSGHVELVAAFSR